jgi:hypothetical protein
MQATIAAIHHRADKIKLIQLLPQHFLQSQFSQVVDSFLTMVYKE